jgi:2-polyprenyl-3-methyl-5-hydroxy-6-metoxy-1,4-benzoquinol methylase
MYSLKPYWRGRASLHGKPDIAKRCHLYLSDGRVAYWLSVIGQYGPAKGRVIEVGCAPGILLQCLHEQGYDCLGVEAAQDTAKWVGHHTGLKILTGVFPDVNLPPCDLFLALDVLEHSYDPLGFMKGVHDVLNPGGKAIIQSPIAPSDQDYDIKTLFTSDFKKMFNDLHVFIFNTNAIHQLAEVSDLIVVGHEIVVLGPECTTLPSRTGLKEKAMVGMRRLP